MTPGEHPEHLLDRALAGDLGTAERAAMDVHVAACGACAMHLDLAARRRNGTSPAHDDSLNRLAIAGALARVRSGRSRSARRLVWLPLRWAIPGLALVAGAAMAGLAFRSPRPPETPALETSTAARRPSPAAFNPPAPPAPLAPAPHAAETPEGQPFAPPPDNATRPVPSAQGLFARATELRRQGHVGQALETYGALQRRYPRTREASLSFAVAGRLQLERGRPALALLEFDRYLKVDQEVAEEALAGRAEALQRLHRSREEAAAWTLLLGRFPKSVYSAQARSRLAALAQR